MGVLQDVMSDNLKKDKAASEKGKPLTAKAKTPPHNRDMQVDPSKHRTVKTDRGEFKFKANQSNRKPGK